MTGFDQIPLFYFLLPLVAFLYASVGHGGASGYIALMILFSFPQEEMKSTALILNICVSSISFLHYLRKGHFNLRIYLLVGLISIPAAYYGGKLNIDPFIYKKILGVFLLFAVMRLLGFPGNKNATDELKKPNIYIALGTGLAIGFFSGMLGIGGGILLTPVLLLLHWANMKEAAGVSALFILVNSVSGLFGQINGGKFLLNEHILLLAICAVAGGLLGGYLGSSKFSSRALKYLLAAVLILATYKLFFS